MDAESRVAGLLLIAVAFWQPPAAVIVQPPATPASPTPMALVETWPDGRVNYEIASPRPAWMWTAAYPSIKGYRPPEGTKPVFAVRFARVLVGQDIKVDVSVLLGGAEPPGVTVASVVISPGSQVVIEDLGRFGVQPPTLSSVTVARMKPYVPTVASVSPQIEVANVELLESPYPGYRLTLRNLGSKGVSNVHLQSYRGDAKALSAIKRSDDGRPLMPPGESCTFDVNLTSGAANGSPVAGTWTPLPLDVINIDAVRWDDGSYDGTTPNPQVDRLIEGQSGERLQLRRVVDSLTRTLAERASGEAMLMSLRTRIEALPDAEPDQLAEATRAMRGMKQAARDEIARFERSHPTEPSSSNVVEWLKSLLARYNAELTRVSP
ncbi:MAG TPA: hypothetical protein VGH34_09365 [Vicinamibacterales bacterium]